MRICQPLANELVRDDVLPGRYADAIVEFSAKVGFVLCAMKPTK
jgi:hypothetical protein